MFHKILNKYHITQVTENNVGKSGDGVYYLKNNKESYYLKVSKNDEIINEVKAYRYLDGLVNVPKVYEFEKDEDGRFYLLMSEVKGKMLYELLKEDVVDTITLYARSLRMLHNLPHSDFPNKRDLYDTVRCIQYRLDEIDVTQLEEITIELGIEKTYERLVSLFPEHRDLVLCHGDYCMPNVIVGDQVGFIDLGRSTVDDRYLDIALALRSLETNCELANIPYSLEYEKLFLKEYGIQEIDKRKREFYYLLDEFF